MLFCIHSSPTLFFGQSRAKPAHLFFSASEASAPRVYSTHCNAAPAPRASHCKRHLPLKMHREVIFYYLVTTVCRFKVLCLLTPPGVDPSFLRPVISKHQLSAFSFQPPDQCNRIGRPGQFDHQLLAESR